MEEEIFFDQDEMDTGFEPPLLIDEAETEVIGTGTLQELQEQQKEEVKPETPPIVPEGGTEAAPTGDAPAEQEEEFEEPDTTNWSEKVSAELKDAVDLFGIKPTQVTKREDYEFVQDQMSYVRQAMESDEEFAIIQERKQLPGDVLVANFINDKYGDEFDEDELSFRMSRYIDPDTGELNAKGKALEVAQRAALEQAEMKKVEQFKNDSKRYAFQQHQFYSELTEKVKTFQPKVPSIKVGQEEIELTEVPKLPVAQKRLLKTFLETDYLATARAEAVPDGKSKAQVIAENAFWLNPKVRDSYLADLLAKTYQRGQSDYAAKNIFK